MFWKNRQKYDLVVMDGDNKVQNNASIGYYFNPDNTKGVIPRKGELLEIAVRSCFPLGNPFHEDVLVPVRDVICPLEGLPRVVVERPKVNFDYKQYPRSL